MAQPEAAAAELDVAAAVVDGSLAEVLDVAATPNDATGDAASGEGADLAAAAPEAGPVEVDSSGGGAWDAGQAELETSDAAIPDAGPTDTAPGDSGLSDTTAADATVGDAELSDTGPAESGLKDASPGDSDASTAAPFWVTAYYAAWMHGHLPPDQIDFGAVTSVVNFSIFPKANGTFDLTSNGITAAETKALVSAAHQHKRQALLGVGGSWTHDGFAVWMKPAKRAEFVKLIVQQLQTGGYDGVDLDMEPVFDSDAADFVPFVKDLRAAMDAKNPKLVLTAAVGWREAVYAPVKKHFDRIGIMTYDLSGPWSGWETWHGSPLSTGGLKFASTNQPLPSCQTLVDEALSAQAPLAKLGIGIIFYAYVWQGATGPNQPIAGVSMQSGMPYFEMMDNLYNPNAALWHAAAQAPYLSLGKGAKGQFVSYDDAQSIAAKIAWAKKKGLGGVIIWELGGGWRPQKPPGKQDPLLQAVKAAAFP